MSGALGDVANNLGSQLGMINALRTGNPMLDMAICMLIPLFFQMLVQLGQHFQPLLNRIMVWLNSGGEFYVRTIEFECRTTPWGSVIRSNGKEERNNILQKALILFISEIKSIEYLNAKVSLMAITEKGKRDDNTYEMVYGSTADQLSCYSVNIVPPSGVWVTIRDELQFMQNTDEENNEGKDGKPAGPAKNTTSYTFKVPKACGEKVIEDFIQEAFDWYVAKVKSNQDHGRYLYMLIKNIGSSSDKDNEGGADSSARVYKRYRLSGEKTFHSMFFKEKQMMLKLLGHFEKKTGKYAIKGFPHKLGLLLHGPPGTGKTSLIKALAEHTGRSVVSISLSRIETNQELMDIVFDQSFLIKGEDMPIKLGFKDIIFVMEDVDAASPIVHARSVGEKEEEVAAKPTIKLQRQVTTGGTEIADVTKNETIEVVKPEKDSAAKDQGEMSDGDLVTALITSLTDPVSTDGKKAGPSKYFSAYDKLDLSGLLNVLDGVVDCPNRILVMTTNHPEKLDPALIRPGRIDKIVYLGYMQAAEAFEMVEHYFQTPLTEEQKKRIESALAIPLKTTPSAYKLYGDKGFTPAELEQLCAEYDDIDEFLTNLEDRVLENSAVDGPPDLEVVSSTGLSRTASHAPPLRRGLSSSKN